MSFSTGVSVAAMALAIGLYIRARWLYTEAKRTRSDFCIKEESA